MRSIEQRSQVSVEGEAVKIVANSVAPDMSRLGGSIFGCGVRRLAPFEWIGNCGPSRAGSNKVWKWDRHPPAGSPGDTVSAGSETDKTRAQKHVADARSDTQESRNCHLTDNK